MIEYHLLIAVLVGIAVLLFLILTLRFHAFISLLMASIVVGLVAGMDATMIMKTIQDGMANTLGFVATVIGLGAMFGAILEHSGGTTIIANFLINKLGEKRAPSAMLIAGFIIAIPVFFDVAFILLVPVIYALQKKTGKSLLLYALPLLSGLAITHAFIPPTPGPIAVADIIGADLGWVIFIGFIVGLPTAIVSGLIFGKYIGNKIFLPVPFQQETKQIEIPSPKITTVLSIIATPILLILISSFAKSGLITISSQFLFKLINLVGHPFSALIIGNMIAWYVLGIKQNFTRVQLLDITSKSMAPAGAIILITGAGGVFKQMLIDTGAGKMIAESLAEIGFPVLLFSFVVAALVRIIQGSATVAMMTAAGLVAPLIMGIESTNFELASIVIAIAAGASIMSHVNDSGFWLVSQYLGMTEKQTFKSWTMMTTILSLTGFLIIALINFLF